MADLIAMSGKVIDEGIDDGTVGPLNRVNHELSVLSDDIAMVEAFSHSIVLRTDAGLVTFDTSGAQGGRRVVEAIRAEVYQQRRNGETSLMAKGIFGGAANASASACKARLDADGAAEGRD